MSKAKMGATVLYCGHDATFVADIYEVGGVNIIHAASAFVDTHLKRPAQGATHHLMDFPGPVFWKPHIGVFVVPKNQCIDLQERQELESADTRPRNLELRVEQLTGDRAGHLRATVINRRPKPTIVWIGEVKLENKRNLQRAVRKMFPDAPRWPKQVLTEAT